MKRRLLSTRYATGCWPVSAEGEEQLESVTFRNGRQIWRELCDYLACGFGLVPNLELAQLLECEIKDAYVAVDEWQQTSTQGIYCAGEPTGIGGLDLALSSGQIAGYSAAGQTHKAQWHFSDRARALQFMRAMNRTFALREELKALAAADTIVCRCEDVAFGRIKQHHSWRSAKLQTRCGMGPCQGRICGAALDFLLGWKAESVRPPVFPTRLDHLTG